MKLHDVVMEEADDGTKGGAGGEGDDKNKIDVDALAATVKLLAEGVASQQSQLKTVVEKLDEIGKNDGRGVDGGGEEGDDTGDDKGGKGEVDLEQLDRKAFAALMQSRIVNAIRKELQESHGKEVKNVADRLASAEARESLRELSSAKPDLLEWKAEMGEELKRNPHLSFEDAYILSRTRHTEKAAKLDEKAKQDANKNRKPSTGFGGLTPTSGMSTGGKSKMTLPEAAEAAFDQVAAEFGDVFRGS